MTDQTRKRNPRSSKARASSCARCGQTLKRARTLIPLIGVVGPECEGHVLEALERLKTYGLKCFFPTGEYRLAAPVSADGIHRAPREWYELSEMGRDYSGVRVGLRLEPDGDARVWVMTLNSSDLHTYVRRYKAVTA